jgi:hypothetical protein
MDAILVNGACYMVSATINSAYDVLFPPLQTLIKDTTRLNERLKSISSAAPLRCRDVLRYYQCSLITKCPALACQILQKFIHCDSK